MIKKIFKSLNKEVDKFISLIYPKRCPVCDKPIFDKRDVHADCREKLRIIRDPMCSKCGTQLADDEDIICPTCKKNDHIYDIGFSIYIYNDAMKRTMYRYKYLSRAEYSNFFAQEAIKKIKEINLDFDIIIPVPIHKMRLKKRGYNQSELIAKIIAKELDIEFSSDVIVRKRYTVAQKGLSIKQRKKNLKNTIQPNKYIINNKDVLLIDDIYTTGTTIDNCAEVLKRMGARKVYFLAIAS